MIDTSSIVLGLLAIVPTVIGWLVKRGVDGLSRDVADLKAQGTTTLVQLESLRVRVTHLEYLVMHSGKRDAP